MKWLIFVLATVSCSSLYSEEIWTLSPRITAMGGVRFTSFDEEYTPNMWDISGIKASRVFDVSERSEIMLKGFGSSDCVTFRDTSFFVDSLDTCVVVQSFDVEQRDEGTLDIFFFPKESFYFGASAHVKQDVMTDTIYDTSPFFLESSEKLLTVEGYSGWRRDNVSICISMDSRSLDAINYQSQTHTIEASLCFFVKPSFHIGIVQGYSRRTSEYAYESYTHGKLYIQEAITNTSYGKAYIDWQRNEHSVIGISTGISASTYIFQPYDESPRLEYNLDDFLFFYYDVFKYGDLEIPVGITNFFGLSPWGEEQIDDYDITDFSFESGVRWKERILCFGFNQYGDLRIGAEFPIANIKIRTGYIYEGGLREWVDLSPHIVSGGIGIPVGNKCKFDMVIKEMYGIYIGGAEVSMDL